MNRISLILALFGYVSCAALDQLQYLPPQGSPSQNQQPYQPLDAPGITTIPEGFALKPQDPGKPSTQYSSNFESKGAAVVQGPQYSQDQVTTELGNSFGPQGFAVPQYSQGQSATQYSGNIKSNAVAGPEQYIGPQQYTSEQRSPLADVPILRYENVNDGDGQYRYAYGTGNGIAAQEEGSALSGWNKAQGSFQFTSPEGKTFDITYTADENGYVPQGAHLPTPPPIPDAILKSLETIRQAQARGIPLEGQYVPEGDDGQYHESHDEGQYNAQHHQGGYQSGSLNASKNEPQEQRVPQGFSLKNDGQQRFIGQQGTQHQPLAENGGYKY